MTPTEFALKPLTSSAPLSKSKFVHGMQCPLYVWLEVRTDAPSQTMMHSPWRCSRRATMWEAASLQGVLITEGHLHHADAVETTLAALAYGVDAICEAAFTYNGVKMRVDVLERLADGTFALHDLKSTSAYDKKKHLLDAAVQLWVVRGVGLPVTFVGLAHLNRAYAWPGGGYDLEQLFAEEDITDPAEAIQEGVSIDAARLLRVLESSLSSNVSRPRGYASSRRWSMGTSQRRTRLRHLGA